MIPPKLIALAAVLAGSIGAVSQSSEGIWRGEGWGSVYEIRGPALQSFEVTEATCVPGFSATRISQENTRGEIRFRANNRDVYIVASDEAHKSLRRPAGLISVNLSRVASLPQTCTPPTANRPLSNFEVFARTFAEQYISFEARQLDWDRVVAQQRAKIGPNTTPKQLFEILTAMIAPLNDIHTGLEAPKIRRNFDPSLRAGTDRVIRGNLDRFAKQGRRELAAVTNRAYLRNPVVSMCHGSWQYGLTEGDVGYLRIFQFGDYASKRGYDSDLVALNRALDQILGNPKLRGLIIDVRLSFGGDDRLGLAIAGRLTSHEYMAYAIQARSDATRRNVYTPLQPVFVKPGKQPTFSGPVVEMMGPITMSAAETFTQALMERAPHVIRIGENTQGVFCDSLDRHLPNGWTFALPNAVYRGSDGRAFDVSGIPPDVSVPVFADEDVAAGRDPAMAMALRLLHTKLADSSSLPIQLRDQPVLPQNLDRFIDR